MCAYEASLMRVQVCATSIHVRWDWVVSEPGRSVTLGVVVRTTSYSHIHFHSVMGLNHVKC